MNMKDRNLLNGVKGTKTFLIFSLAFKFLATVQQRENNCTERMTKNRT